MKPAKVLITIGNSSNKIILRFDTLMFCIKHLNLMIYTEIC